jgi:hypothetical protein
MTIVFWRRVIMLCGLLLPLLSAGSSLAQDFSPDSVVKFADNITIFNSKAKQDAAPLKGQREFALIVYDLFDDDYACGLREDLLEYAAIAFTKDAPFKLVRENRHPTLWVEVQTERTGQLCISHVNIKAEYAIHITLPNQAEPWFARIPMWEGIGFVITDNDPKKHLGKVVGVLRDRLNGMAGDWEDHNQ